MRAVLVTGPTAADWQEADIDPNTIGVLQKLVGGFIERIPCTDPAWASVYRNDRGKLDDLPITAHWLMDGRVVDGLRGPLVIVGAVDEAGDHLPLTEYGLDHAKAAVAPPDSGSGEIEMYYSPSGRLLWEKPLNEGPGPERTGEK